MPTELFISHAHKDARIANCLVTFLVTGVGVEAKEVRCTSHTAAGLRSGADIADQLREDIKRCRVFLPLVTENSVASEFVAFEIGAAWALEKESVVPLVYGSRKKVRIPSLLAGFLYRDISRESELVRVGEDLASEVFVRADRPSASQLHAAAGAFLECVSTRTATSRRRRHAG
jgi:TIR domain